MNFVQRILLKATHLATLTTGGTIIATYQNNIIGRVIPLSQPINFPRGSTDEDVIEIYKAAADEEQS